MTPVIVDLASVTKLVRRRQRNQNGLMDAEAHHATLHRLRKVTWNNCYWDV